MFSQGCRLWSSVQDGNWKKKCHDCEKTRVQSHQSITSPLKKCPITSAPFKLWVSDLVWVNNPPGSVSVFLSHCYGCVLKKLANQSSNLVGVSGYVVTWLLRLSLIGWLKLQSRDRDEELSFSLCVLISTCWWCCWPHVLQKSKIMQI